MKQQSYWKKPSSFPGVRRLSRRWAAGWVRKQGTAPGFLAKAEHPKDQTALLAGNLADYLKPMDPDFQQKFSQAGLPSACGKHQRI